MGQKLCGTGVFVFINGSALAIMVYDECQVRVVQNVIMKIYIADTTEKM